MKIHIVQKGETLWEIANKYGVDYEQLKSINVHIASPDMIMPGMKIKIPTDDKHVKHKTVQETKVKQHGEVKKEKPSHKSDKMVLPEQSISLGQQGLPSPIAMPKLTFDQQKAEPSHHYEKKKHSHQQKPSSKPNVQNKPQHHTVPHIHHMPHQQHTTPMYGPPMNICPVCGQVNQHMMPHYYPGNVWPPYMPYGNFQYEHPMQQQHMSQTTNNKHNYK